MVAAVSEAEVEKLRLYSDPACADLLRAAAAHFGLQPDQIIDVYKRQIVETGTTLRENGLKVVTEFLPISARFIANKASYQFKHCLLYTSRCV